MNIAIIGAGNIGTGFARRLLASNHGIVLADIDAAKATAAAQEAGGSSGRVQSAPLEAAIAQAEIVVLAVPFSASEVIAGGQAAQLAGRIVVDVTNPLTPDFMGLTLGFDTSAAERIAALLPGARVVKGFNTIFAQIHHDARGGAFGDRRAQALLASDDAQAKSAVAALAEVMGYEPVDAGPLANARFIEPLAALNIQLGYALGRGTQIAPAWLAR